MNHLNRDFTYTGEARDFGGTDAYHYEGVNWIIGVWVSVPSKHILLQGSLENMSGDTFHFTLEDSWMLTYARVLQSNFDGLGKRYDEDDKLVPKYVVEKIKQIAQQILRKEAEWQVST